MNNNSSFCSLISKKVHSSLKNMSISLIENKFQHTNTSSYFYVQSSVFSDYH